MYSKFFAGVFAVAVVVTGITATQARADDPYDRTTVEIIRGTTAIATELIRSQDDDRGPDGYHYDRSYRRNFTPGIPRGNAYGLRKQDRGPVYNGRSVYSGHHGDRNDGHHRKSH